MLNSVEKSYSKITQHWGKYPNEDKMEELVERHERMVRKMCGVINEKAQKVDSRVDVRVSPMRLTVTKIDRNVYVLDFTTSITVKLTRLKEARKC